ncbi:MAG: LrgB family protein, partial [Lachnospiraceae bacterium]|nr:LrgB family protein [Lachnospiraceae bacterium]
MKEFITESVFFGVVITLVTYELGMWMKKKLKFAICNPLLIAIIAIILFLIGFDIDYEVYNEGAQFISYLLTPATVCLAVPLYEQFELLKKNVTAVLAGILAGVLTSATCVLVLCVLMKLGHEQYVTLLPKSITTAIGMVVSEELGGYATITVAVIVVTGIFGYIMADFILKIFRITDPIAKGVAIGTSSHAGGTARAMELGEVEGAMSSLSIAVAGLTTVLVTMI